MSLVQVAPDKLLAGLNGTNSAVLVVLYIFFIQPMQDDIGDLNGIALDHAARCYVDQKYFEGLAADKVTAADQAKSVAQRYRTMAEFQELSVANRNRMLEMQENETRFRAEAAAFTQSAQAVCQVQ